jgi:hypothetical protein
MSLQSDARVQTVVVGSGNGRMDPALSRLRMDLTQTTVLSGIGVCGIDGIVDAATSVASSGPQWFLNMPAFVVPMTLIGWIATLLSCRTCWVCVCCLEDRSALTVQQSVTVEKPPEPPRDPAQGVPLVPPPPPSQAPGTEKNTTRAFSTKSSSCKVEGEGVSFQPPCTNSAATVTAPALGGSRVPIPPQRPTARAAHSVAGRPTSLCAAQQCFGARLGVTDFCTRLATARTCASCRT